MIYPNNFEQRIGFDTIRNNIKKMCVNDLSCTFIDKLGFLNDYFLIKNRLDYCQEMFGILESNVNILPIYPVDEFRFIFKSTEVEGTFLEANTIFLLKKLLENINLLVDFFLNKDNEKYPLLTKYVSNIEVFPNILKEISKILDKNGEIKDSASPELFKIRASKSQVQNSVSKTLQRILQKAQSDDIVERDATPVIREGRLVIPVLSMNKRKIEGIIHDESATGKTFYIEPSQVVFLNNKLRELESEECKEIVRILIAFTSYIRPYYSAILRSQKLYLQTDALNAIVKYAMRIKAICPTLKNECIVDWQKGRHPILQELLEKQGNRIVPLNIALNQKDRIIVISGANAGGKSVCIKTVCLLQYMLQCGIPIPIDESSTAGVFDSVFLDIGDGQNIENDLSTYSSHLQNMKFFVKNATNKTLVVIDEFGSGTEPEIGGAIAQATLQEFCRIGLFGLITTHYTNLKYFAEQTDGVVNGAMLYDKSRLKPLFELKIGQAGSSFALEIARNIGLPAQIIESAEQLVGSNAINYDKLTQAAIKNKTYWENKREKIRLQSKKQDAIINDYQAKLLEIENTKKDIIRQAKQEAKLLIDSANATIENTIRAIKESHADKSKTSEARQQIKTFAQSISTEVKTSKTDKTLKIDDAVVIKGQNAVGRIVKISDKKAVVVFGSIRTSVKLSDLEIVSNNQAKKATKATLAKSTVNEIRKKQLSFSQEIDVRGMRVNEALQAVMYYIDDARMANVSRVRILHGTGEGVLRQAIRDYLAEIYYIKSFADEHIQLGGAGITVVNF
ncbi:MAG: Smr/MutS family protein [Porphyromonadaceae bacterium]|nr:Smr/MutS family protein [Porphyromonadaceae bacterium]